MIACPAGNGLLGGCMRRDLLWLLGVLLLVALGARLQATLRPTAQLPSASEADRVDARAVLHPASLPAATNQRRLQLYNDLRDRMDAQRYGVLEAVAAELRAAPDQAVAPGYDLVTFYSAVGGDNDFRGGGEEDWGRLERFQDGWLQALPGSRTALRARLQTLEGAYRAGKGRDPQLLERARGMLGEVARLVPGDPKTALQLEGLSR